MVTAQQLYLQSQIRPSMLGEDIISPDLETEEEQVEAAIEWFATNVLPIAQAEVAVPFMQATGYDAVDEFVDGKFEDTATDTKDRWKSSGSALYDAAVISYGRSEAEKAIASSAETYDRDSDQNRIQGNQRLEKLIGWAMALNTESTADDEVLVDSLNTLPRASTTQRRVARWWGG